MRNTHSRKRVTQPFCSRHACARDRPDETPYFLAVWFFILCVCQSASCSADSKSLAKSEASGSRNRETMITAAGSSFKAARAAPFVWPLNDAGLFVLQPEPGAVFRLGESSEFQLFFVHSQPRSRLALAACA
jgi:hypothetical protein